MRWQNIQRKEKYLKLDGKGVICKKKFKKKKNTLNWMVKYLKKDLKVDNERAKNRKMFKENVKVSKEIP